MSHYRVLRCVCLYNIYIYIYYMEGFLETAVKLCGTLWVQKQVGSHS